MNVAGTMMLREPNNTFVKKWSNITQTKAHTISVRQNTAGESADKRASVCNGDKIEREVLINADERSAAVDVGQNL